MVTEYYSKCGGEETSDQPPNDWGCAFVSDELRVCVLPDGKLRTYAKIDAAQAQAGVARLRARRRRQGAPRCKKTRVRLGSYLGVRRELEAHLGCFGITKHSLLHALSVLYPHSIVQKSPYHPLSQPDRGRCKYS